MQPIEHSLAYSLFRAREHTSTIYVYLYILFFHLLFRCFCFLLYFISSVSSHLLMCLLLFYLFFNFNFELCNHAVLFESFRHSCVHEIASRFKPLLIQIWFGSVRLDFSLAQLFARELLS